MVRMSYVETAILFTCHITKYQQLFTFQTTKHLFIMFKWQHSSLVHAYEHHFLVTKLIILNRLSHTWLEAQPMLVHLFQWARELGKKTKPNRVNVPVHACEHYYLVTKPIGGTDPLMPVLRDPDGYIYVREWNGGILAGGFEPNPVPCFHNGIPDKFEFQLLQEDWDHFRKISSTFCVKNKISCSLFLLSCWLWNWY